MSEFTSGNLLLKKNRNVLERKERNKDFIIKDINEKWTALFTEDYYDDTEIPNYILDISQQCPVCYFFNYEDHGWGYRIFFNRKELANINISYELEFYTIVEIAQEIYPREEDIIEFLCCTEEGKEVYEQIREEIVTSDIYINSIRDQFANSNADVFTLFEISEDIIDRFKIILTPEHLLKLESKFELVEEFKKLIGIEEMEWMSFDYLVE